MSIGDFPEDLSQAMVVGCNVSREIGRVSVSPMVSRSIGSMKSRLDRGAAILILVVVFSVVLFEYVS